MSNNSNSYDLDQAQIRNKTWNNDVVRATVLDVLPDIHAVRVNPRGDNAPFIAPVLTPRYGMQMLPSEGSRVTVIYIAENVPLVIGGVYLTDGENPPNEHENDVVFGNGTGSRVSVENDGSIDIITEGNNPVDIDVQSASVELQTQQSIPPNTWTKVEWDNAEDDNDDLFRESTYSIEARYGGLYQINASAMFPNPGQNNRYDIGIFVNDSIEKQITKQSANNLPMSLQVQTDELLNSGDEIDVRVMQDSGNSKTLNGEAVTDEFSVNRTGRRRGEDV